MACSRPNSKGGLFANLRGGLFTDSPQSIDQSVECGYASAWGTVPTGRVERIVVLVSYAHNEREDIDIDIDGASWLEGNCEPGSKHEEQRCVACLKAASPCTGRRELRRSLGQLPQWTMGLVLAPYPPAVGLGATSVMRTVRRDAD